MQFLCFICKLHSAHHVFVFFNLIFSLIFWRRYDLLPCSPSHNPLWWLHMTICECVIWRTTLINKALVLTTAISISITYIFSLLLKSVSKCRKKGFEYLFVVKCFMNTGVFLCLHNEQAVSDHLKATENRRFRGWFFFFYEQHIDVFRKPTESTYHWTISRTLFVSKR